MSRRAQLAVHLVALVVVLFTVAYLAVRNGDVIPIFLAALLGFVSGLLMDRWLLRPMVDASMGSDGRAGVRTGRRLSGQRISRGCSDGVMTMLLFDAISPEYEVAPFALVVLATLIASLAVDRRT
jgi:hypothetical protein